MQFIFQRCCFTVLFLLFCGVSDAYPLHTKDTDEVLNDHADALIDFCSKHIDEYLLNGVHIEPEGVAELLNRQNINFLDVFLHCLDADLVQSVGANSDVAKRIICERVQQRYHKNAAYQENFPSYREQFDRNLKQYKNGFADGSKIETDFAWFFQMRILFDLIRGYVCGSFQNLFYKFGFSRGHRERISKLNGPGKPMMVADIFN